MLGSSAVFMDGPMLRRLVVQTLRDKRDKYSPLLTEYSESEGDGFDAYCTKMELETTWGGQLEIEVCNDLLLEWTGNKPESVLGVISFEYDEQGLQLKGANTTVFQYPGHPSGNYLVYQFGHIDGGERRSRTGYHFDFACRLVFDVGTIFVEDDAVTGGADALDAAQRL